MKSPWKPGDIARIVRNVQCASVPELEKYAGEEVVLMCFSGVILAHENTDWWIVKHCDGCQFYVRENALRRRDDPGEFERGSWSEILKETGWNPQPIKERVT